MAVIPRTRKLKNGKKKTSYQVEVSVRGVRVASRSFDTKSAAHAWEEETKQRYLKGLSNPSAALSFGDCVRRYSQEEIPRLRKSSQQARASRLRYLEEAPILGVGMEEFTGSTVDEWLKWLLRHPTAKAKGRKSFDQELKLMSTVLSWYREVVDLTFVVPIGKRHRQQSRFKFVAPRRADHYIRPAEVAQWLRHLRDQRPDPVYHRLAQFMVLTGFRMGEATGLCWDAVDLEGASPAARVVRTLTWDYRTKEPSFQQAAKNESSIRSVALPPVLIEMLAEMRPCGAAGPVFLNRKGALLKDNVIRANFNAGFQACGLPWSGTHIARHTAATLGLIATRDLSAIQAQMGHKSQKQTEHYAKVMALEGNNAATQTAELIGLRPRNHVTNHV